MPEPPQPESSQRAPLNPPTGWKPRLERWLRTVFELRNLYLLRVQLRFAPTEAQRLFGLTIAIGVLCGLAAVAFHGAIRFVEGRLINRAMGAAWPLWVPLTILTPMLGALACGWLLTYVAPNARGSGVPQVKAAFANVGPRLRLRDSVAKFLICALQIGSGSALGREGPTVHICAGIASAFRSVPGISPRSARRLMPVGVAAGIAAAFNAPIAAVTFTIEEVVGKLDQAVLSGVIVAAALAAVIERSVLGEHPMISVPPGYGLHHASSLLIYALIGVAAAVVSVAFTDALLKTRAAFRKSKLPEWARPGVGGLVTGALAAAALAGLGTRGVTGGGYDTLVAALTGQVTLGVMVALLGLKLVATVASYSSGGAGGIFAPSLFIGAMLGGSFGVLDHLLLGHTEGLGAFALVGMGAVFAGVIRAPMTSVLIIIEMTGGYSLILPLMISNMAAYILARAWRPTPIYEALLEQDGVHLSENVVMDALEAVPVARLLKPHEGLRTVQLATTAAEVTKVAAAQPPQEMVPVLDDDGRLRGVITRDEVKMVAGEAELQLLVNAADLMRPVKTARREDDLRVALEAMIANGVRQLPVLDDDGRMVGLLEESDVVKAYLRGQRPTAPRHDHSNG
ncbi:MAG: chloride channel protein [Myxococcota bacterium]